MKKILVCLLCLACVFALSACAQADTAPLEDTPSATTRGVGIVIDVSESKSAEAEKEGTAVTDTTICAVTLDAQNRITSAWFDVVETKISFSADGTLSTDLNTEQKTKRELGDAYGMGKVAKAGEWYKQADAFGQWCEGKTVDEVMAAAGSMGGTANMGNTGDAVGTDSSAAPETTLGMDNQSVALPDASPSAEPLVSTSPDTAEGTTGMNTGAPSTAASQMEQDLQTSCTISKDGFLRALQKAANTAE